MTSDDNISPLSQAHLFSLAMINTMMQQYDVFTSSPFKQLILSNILVILGTYVAYVTVFIIMMYDVFITYSYSV